ncbi:hypothetical protein PWT90_11173 [Aphanocladium album]|nr:hypothetical protein PWT90_11173 [Aphanocladium album]
MASFHQFPKLPPEVRAYIWAYSIEHRTVDIRALQGSRPPHRGGHYSLETPDTFTPVPVPAVMSACRESRNLQLYEKFEYSYPAEGRCSVCSQETAVAGAGPAQPEQQRYTWVNFEMDMIDIGRDGLPDVKHMASRIQRLMLERDNANEYWWYEEGHELIGFRNLDAVHVLSPHPLVGWCEAWEERYWCRKKENLLFIDKATGQVANVDEVDAMGLR